MTSSPNLTASSPGISSKRKGKGFKKVPSPVSHGQISAQTPAFLPSPYRHLLFAAAAEHDSNTELHAGTGVEGRPTSCTAWAPPGRCLHQQGNFKVTLATDSLFRKEGYTVFSPFFFVGQSNLFTYNLSVV